jgi:hypothetical protein
MDEVICAPVESAIHQLSGTFDLIVCADVLEHLVDPWSIVRQLLEVAESDTVLAISMPNIRYLPALTRIAVGSGFSYEDQGIFDSSHLRFFTRGNMEHTLRQGGWTPERWGAPTYRRLRTVRSLLQQATRRRSDDWLAVQLYVAARPERL